MSNAVSIAGEFLRSARRPLIAVVGPTASGKTDASVRLALALNALPAPEKGSRALVEIINADSRQLYRGMDVGTAKVAAEEMNGVPHHLLDVLDPNQEATAAWYQGEATTIIDAILARGNIPMLVGGSMLYVNAVIDGYAFPPAADPQVRSALSDAYDRDGGKTLHAKLAEIDPETAASIPYQNKPYVIRALELAASTGTKPLAKAPAYDVLLLGVTRPREELIARIGRRTKQLIKHGWIEEVQRLREAGYTAEDPGMKSHGYREILAYLERGGDKEALIAEIAKKTRQYAKRQMTWWRGDGRVRWMSQEG